MTTPATPPAGAPLAVYRRRVRASLERVWENVLDWEHLPWLHAHAFAPLDPPPRGGGRLERLAGARDGWRVRTAVPSVPGAREIVVALEADRERGCYVARTLEGSGAGTEIWTRLTAQGAETLVEVSFHVPGLPDGARGAVGRAYVALYTRLWDEDEAMMRRRQEVLDGGLLRARPGPAGELALGPAELLRARAPCVVEAGGVPLRVVLREGALWAHSFVCPHLGGPLEVDDADGGVRCPWHGYRFDLHTRACAGGRPFALPFARPVVVDGGGQARLPLDPEVPA